MARTETIRARVEPELKSEAEAILKEVGLSSSEAMRLFLYQIVRQRGLPFEVKVQLTAVAQIKAKVDLVAFVEGIMQMNQERMPDSLQDLLFCNHSTQPILLPDTSVM